MSKFSQVTKIICHNNCLPQAVQLLLDIHLFNKVNGFSIENFSPPEKLEVEIVCVAQ